MKYNTIRVVAISILLLFIYNIVNSQCVITDTDGNPPGTMSCGTGFGFCLEPSATWCFGSNRTYTNSPEILPSYPNGECAIAYLMYWSTKIPFNDGFQNTIQDAIWYLQGTSGTVGLQASILAQIALDVCSMGSSFNFVSFEYDHCDAAGNVYYDFTIETRGFIELNSSFIAEDNGTSSFKVFDNGSNQKQTIIDIVTEYNNGPPQYTFSVKTHPGSTGCFGTENISYNFKTFATNNMQINEYHVVTPDNSCQILGQSLWTGGGASITEHSGSEAVWRSGKVVTVSECINDEYFVDICISGVSTEPQYQLVFHQSTGGTITELGTYRTTEHFGPFTDDITSITYTNPSITPPHCIEFEPIEAPCLGDCTINTPIVNISSCSFINGEQNFYYTINTTAMEVSGNYNISGDDTQNNLMFGTLEGPFGPFVVSSGDLDIVLEAQENNTCPLNVVVPSNACPASCGLGGCLNGTLIKD